LHGCLIEQPQVLGVDDLRRAIHEEDAVIGVGAQGIGDEGDVDRTNLIKAAHDADIATALLLQHAGKRHGCGRGS